MTPETKRSPAGANIVMITATVILLLFPMNGKAEETEFKSQGKIVFDNRTEDPADDVIFDASDFNKLAFTCR